jgi:hypothetical protein
VKKPSPDGVVVVTLGVIEGMLAATSTDGTGLIKPSGEVTIGCVYEELVNKPSPPVVEGATEGAITGAENIPDGGGAEGAPVYELVAFAASPTGAMSTPVVAPAAPLAAVAPLIAFAPAVNVAARAAFFIMSFVESPASALAPPLRAAAPTIEAAAPVAPREEPIIGINGG